MSARRSLGDVDDAAADLHGLPGGGGFGLILEVDVEEAAAGFPRSLCRIDADPDRMADVQA